MGTALTRSSLLIGVNAYDYMVLGRMIHFFLPEQKILKVAARRVTLYFVLFDIAYAIFNKVPSSC